MIQAAILRIRAKLKLRRRYKLWRMKKRRSAALESGIPQPPLWSFPIGLKIGEIDQTSVRFVDGFCTPQEAAGLINIAKNRVNPSSVLGAHGKSITHDYRTSSDTKIGLVNADPLVRSIVARAAGLLGLPMAHAESLNITRYRAGEYYKSHLDHDGSPSADRIYTTLLYLNDLGESDGGGTLFEDLNFVTKPVCGRAIFWINSDRAGRALPQYRHASLPVTNDDAEKWVAQIWFRTYIFSDGAHGPNFAEWPESAPLQSSADLPFGISFAAKSQSKSAP